MTRGFDLLTYEEVGRAAHTKDAQGQPQNGTVFKRAATPDYRDYFISDDTTPPDGFRRVGTLHDFRDEGFYE